MSLSIALSFSSHFLILTRPATTLTPDLFDSLYTSLKGHTPPGTTAMLQRPYITPSSVAKRIAIAFGLSDLQHSVQGDTRPVLDLCRHLNAVDDPLLHEIFQSPAEMLGRDTEHGGAEAAGLVKSNYHLVLPSKLLTHAID